MANEQNLIKNENLTPTQRRENARKAGIASAKKRAERKTLKEELLILLAEDNTQNKISVALLKKAMNGDTKAYEIIRDTIGEKINDKIDINAEVNNPFTGMTTEELRKIANSE